MHLENNLFDLYGYQWGHLSTKAYEKLDVRFPISYSNTDYKVLVTESVGVCYANPEYINTGSAKNVTKTTFHFEHGSYDTQWAWLSLGW